MKLLVPLVISWVCAYVAFWLLGFLLEGGMSGGVPVAGASLSLALRRLRIQRVTYLVLNILVLPCGVSRGGVILQTRLGVAGVALGGLILLAMERFAQLRLRRRLQIEIVLLARRRRRLLLHFFVIEGPGRARRLWRQNRRFGTSPLVEVEDALRPRRTAQLHLGRLGAPLQKGTPGVAGGLLLGVNGGLGGRVVVMLP